MEAGRKKWGNYGFEFLSIFIAVVAAFALNNWNDNRRDSEAEEKILLEIRNGLKKDLEDVDVNVKGHELGLESCGFWRKALLGDSVPTNNLNQHYFTILRDFVSIQNTSGYETLKSRGFELIENDSLRQAIISLYEFDYQTLKKLEEDYHENQFHASYFEGLNAYIAPQLKFNQEGAIIGLRQPFRLAEADLQLAQSYLWKLEANRNFLLKIYGQVKEHIIELIEQIETELEL